MNENSREARKVLKDLSGEAEWSDWRHAHPGTLDFTGWDGSNLCMMGCELSNCDFTGANLKLCDFSQSVWKNSVLDKADLTEAVFREALWKRVSAREVCADGICVDRVEWTDVDVSNSSFRQIGLGAIDFYYAELTRVNFTGANLRGVELTLLATKQDVVWPDTDTVIEIDNGYTYDAHLQHDWAMVGCTEMVISEWMELDRQGFCDLVSIHDEDYAMFLQYKDSLFEKARALTPYPDEMGRVEV